MHGDRCTGEVCGFWAIQDGQQPPIYMVPVHRWWYCKPPWNWRLQNCTCSTSSPLSSGAGALCPLCWVYCEGSYWRYWDVIFRGLAVMSKNVTEGVAVTVSAPLVPRGRDPLPPSDPPSPPAAEGQWMQQQFISNDIWPLALISQTVAYTSHNPGTLSLNSKPWSTFLTSIPAS